MKSALICSAMLLMGCSAATVTETELPKAPSFDTAAHVPAWRGVVL